MCKMLNFRCSWGVWVMLKTLEGVYRHSNRLSDVRREFLRNFKTFRIFRQLFWRPSNLVSWRNAPEHRNKTCFGGLCKVLQKNRQYLKHVSNWSPGCWRLFRAVKHDQIIFCRHPKVSRTPHLRGKCPFSRCKMPKFSMFVGRTSDVRNTSGHV
jgi:hypothetical protein